MRAAALLHPLNRHLDRLRGRPLAMLVAGAVIAPVVVALAAAAYCWSTAGRLADYRPAEPSRLYAAPLMLRIGGPADRTALVADLESLGYRRTASEPRLGEMRVADGRFEIGLRREALVERGHRRVATRTLAVGLDGGRVRELRADGRELDGDAAVSFGRPLLYTYYDAELRESRPVRLDELATHAGRREVVAGGG